MNRHAIARMVGIGLAMALSPCIPAQNQAAKPFPPHWGQPPPIQTRDYVPLPAGYGFGSSTLANWIRANLEKDRTNAGGPAGSTLVPPRLADGKGWVSVTGELKTWHKVTLNLDGPFAHERDQGPNPFTDYRMSVTFQHESGAPSHTIPGYFAADGRAGETSAESGTQWRVHLAPDKPGRWRFTVAFGKGPMAAVSDLPAEPLKPYHGQSGSFMVEPTDKSGRDFRARGRLDYVGKHHLRFAGSGEYFLKVGPDAPETLLAYEDFDGTKPSPTAAQRPGEAKPNQKLHRYDPHRTDWRPGDPVWKGDKGKGLIGALNYLSSKGANTISFLPYNAGGDGDNVWPFVERDDKLHYDCSKLDQWGMVFDHATALGLHLHFKLQENEIDDHRRGAKGEPVQIPESLDGGALGPERKLYCRELVARFAHHLALGWNLGEENTQSPEEIRDMARYIHESDPYRHPLVVHTFPDQQEKVYRPLLGDQSMLTGASLQNSWNEAHRRTLQWIRESVAAGKPWVVANDEQNPASMGVPPDPGYRGHNGQAKDGERFYTLDDIRKYCLWGTLLAGGAGVEYYFGYELPENDLVCEDFRSRDRSWDYGRIALEFFSAHDIPFWEMTNADDLVGNPDRDNSRYCLAKRGAVYLVMLPTGGTTTLDLSGVDGSFQVAWFNPREGGALKAGEVDRVTGGAGVALGGPPSDPDQDWVVLVRKGLATSK